MTNEVLLITLLIIRGGYNMSLTTKDKVEQFKRDCKSLKFANEMIRECDERLIEIATKLEGVVSPKFDEIKYKQTRGPYKSNVVELMMQEEEVIQEKKRYKEIVDYINKKLLLIEDVIDYEIIIKVLIENRTLTSVGIEYHMDATTVWRHINSAIKAIL